MNSSERLRAAGTVAAIMIFVCSGICMGLGLAHYIKTAMG